MKMLLILALTATAFAGDVAYIESGKVDAAFKKGVPLLEVDEYKIHASRREKGGEVEVHTRDTDIVYVLSGTATLITGGDIQNARQTGAEEFRGGSVKGGDMRSLRRGDVVVIPNGTPHWFKDVSAPFTYYVVKVRSSREATPGGGK